MVRYHPLDRGGSEGVADVRVFLETERLVLRQFTEADVDNLVELDGDPDVMRFVTGGKPTPRDVIETEVLPAFLGYYERFAGYGFWAAIEESTGEFLGWFHFRPAAGSPPTRPSSATGCARRLGARATPPRERAR